MKKINEEKKDYSAENTKKKLEKKLEKTPEKKLEKNQANKPTEATQPSQEAIINLTEQGSLRLPAQFCEQLGLKGQQQLIASINASGEIVLKPAAQLPIELYSEARIAEFAQQDSELGQQLQS